ncbi:hypothetical protein KIPB_005734, partial [Kipferlia bialata]
TVSRAYRQVEGAGQIKRQKGESDTFGERETASVHHVSAGDRPAFMRVLLPLLACRATHSAGTKSRGQFVARRRASVAFALSDSMSEAELNSLVRDMLAPAATLIERVSALGGVLPPGSELASAICRIPEGVLRGLLGSVTAVGAELGLAPKAQGFAVPAVMSILCAAMLHPSSSDIRRIGLRSINSLIKPLTPLIDLWRQVFSVVGPVLDERVARVAEGVSTHTSLVGTSPIEAQAEEDSESEEETQAVANIDGRFYPGSGLHSMVCTLLSCDSDSLFEAFVSAVPSAPMALVNHILSVFPAKKHAPVVMSFRTLAHMLKRSRERAERETERAEEAEVSMEGDEDVAPLPVLVDRATYLDVPAVVSALLRYSAQYPDKYERTGKSGSGGHVHFSKLVQGLCQYAVLGLKSEGEGRRDTTEVLSLAPSLLQMMAPLCVQGKAATPARESVTRLILSAVPALTEGSSLLVSCETTVSRMCFLLAKPLALCPALSPALSALVDLYSAAAETLPSLSPLACLPVLLGTEGRMNSLVESSTSQLATLHGITVEARQYQYGVVAPIVCGLVRVLLDADKDGVVRHGAAKAIARILAETPFQMETVGEDTEVISVARCTANDVLIPALRRTILDIAHTDLLADIHSDSCRHIVQLMSLLAVSPAGYPALKSIEDAGVLPLLASVSIKDRADGCARLGQLARRDPSALMGRHGKLSNTVLALIVPLLLTSVGDAFRTSHNKLVFAAVTCIGDIASVLGWADYKNRQYLSSEERERAALVRKITEAATHNQTRTQYAQSTGVKQGQVQSSAGGHSSQSVSYERQAASRAALVQRVERERQAQLEKERERHAKAERERQRQRQAPAAVTVKPAQVEVYSNVIKRGDRLAHVTPGQKMPRGYKMGPMTAAEARCLRMALYGGGLTPNHYRQIAQALWGFSRVQGGSEEAWKAGLYDPILHTWEFHDIMSTTMAIGAFWNALRWSSDWVIYPDWAQRLLERVQTALEDYIPGDAINPQTRICQTKLAWMSSGVFAALAFYQSRPIKKVLCQSPVLVHLLKVWSGICTSGRPTFSMHERNIFELMGNSLSQLARGEGGEDAVSLIRSSPTALEEIHSVANSDRVSKADQDYLLTTFPHPVPEEETHTEEETPAAPEPVVERVAPTVTVERQRVAPRPAVLPRVTVCMHHRKLSDLGPRLWLESVVPQWCARSMDPEDHRVRAYPAVSVTRPRSDLSVRKKQSRAVRARRSVTLLPVNRTPGIVTARHE